MMIAVASNERPNCINSVFETCIQKGTLTWPNGDEYVGKWEGRPGKKAYTTGLGCRRYRLINLLIHQDGCGEECLDF